MVILVLLFFLDKVLECFMVIFFFLSDVFVSRVLPR